MRDGDFCFGVGEIVTEAGGAHLIGLERGHVGRGWGLRRAVTELLQVCVSHGPTWRI